MVSVYANLFKTILARVLPSQICLLFIVTASWFCLNTASQLENMEMLAPPERPSSITNIDELRRYIKELNMYYLILARPRCVFGLTHSLIHHTI
uniref:Neuropeptide Y n=1 Tax=Magallana gigas TaxID=29159 RepID=K1PQ67_MAGGI